MSQRPLFSIIHPSARPDKCEAIYADWMGNAADPSKVEFIRVQDERWGFDGRGPKVQGHAPFENLRIVWNTGRRCYVDAVNAGAKAAMGHILIVIADDQFSCEHWDLRILEALPPMDFPNFNSSVDTQEFVVEVSTGTPNEHDRGIFVMPIVSRARYERLGYLFYPEYESMYADNDLCEHARQDGVVVDARHLMFPHRHEMFDGKGGWKQNVPLDDAYKAQMRPEASLLGMGVFDARKRTKFEPLPPSVIASIKNAVNREFPVHSPATPQASTQSAQGQTIAICYPGETFSSDWVSGFLRLFAHLMSRRFQIQLCPCYTSNVYHTRMELTRMLLTEPNKPDFVLFIDDDNIATPEDFEQLFADLEEHPTVDVMAGWCWIHFTQKNQMFPSCGNMQNGKQLWHDGREWSSLKRVARIDWTGFPFVLMRYAALEKAGGVKAWLPFIDERYHIGMTGEDLAWSIRASEAGVEIAADPRVRVEHMKTVALTPFLGPAPVPAEYKEPRIAAMLRVKNEGRWIKRVIESLSDLCDVGVFVMDDASTDDTVAIARKAGATVWDSPFFDQPLDEGRDKNWLTQQVIGLQQPDWILCVDGDEELERGAAEKIRAELRAHLEIEVWSFRFWHLWGSERAARVDRWYSTFHRYSLFRPGMHGFKSLYTESGVKCHSGLHTGNVPSGQIQNGKAALMPSVRLIHYGPMLKEDRIRKYDYYNRIDPGNEIEDHYRHVAQGDLPHLPASARFKYAGPLEIAWLPEEIAPAPLEWMLVTAAD